MRTKTKTKPESLRIKIIPSTQLTLSQFRASDEFVVAAKKLMATQEFQLMMAVLRNESPSNYSPPTGSNHDDRIAHACKTEGYHLAINNLESMAILNQLSGPLEATFEPEPIKE